MRPTWAEIDVDAIATNSRLLRAQFSPSALCAVVKADGYGHGAIAVAEAARRGGATWLAVALVEEGVQLREAGIEGPILVLSEPRAGEMADAHRAALRPTLYTAAGVDAAAAAASAVHQPWYVHVKVDTGMHRVGVAPERVCALADRIDAREELRLEGVWTHCAVADEPHDPFTATQLDRFDDAVAALSSSGRTGLFVHAANSAGGLAHPRGRYDLVRAGIAVYGIAPSAHVTLPPGVGPALRLRSEVTHVQTVAPGEGVSYGRRWIAERPTRVATVPIGYADGIRRDLPARGGEVLVRGVRLPMAGVVTMDQLMVDCRDVPVEVGDEVVLIGRQGDEQITAEQVADRLGTIGYEVVCAIGARVPRRVVGGRA
jgi:alanine racemase